jgi:hypothetical protein
MIGVTSQPGAGWQPPLSLLKSSVGKPKPTQLHRFGAVGLQTRHGKISQVLLSNWPVTVVPHSGNSSDPQKAVYSPTLKPNSSTPGNQCISVITGVESGQVHSKPASSMIYCSFGRMSGQSSGGMGKPTGSDTKPHNCSMSTTPIALAVQPRSVVQVMVYSK